MRSAETSGVGVKGFGIAHRHRSSPRRPYAVALTSPSSHRHRPSPSPTQFAATLRRRRSPTARRIARRGCGARRSRSLRPAVRCRGLRAAGERGRHATPRSPASCSAAPAAYGAGVRCSPLLAYRRRAAPRPPAASAATRPARDDPVRRRLLDRRRPADRLQRAISRAAQRRARRRARRRVLPRVGATASCRAATCSSISEDDSNRLLELHREDGSCLMIDERPLADGGFVTLVTDVTETPAHRPPAHLDPRGAAPARPPLSRGKAQGRGGQPVQDRVPRPSQPRHPHPAQPHHRLCRPDAARRPTARWAMSAMPTMSKSIKTSGERLLGFFASILDLAELEGGQKRAAARSRSTSTTCCVGVTQRFAGAGAARRAHAGARRALRRRAHRRPLLARAHARQPRRERPPLHARRAARSRSRPMRRATASCSRSPTPASA